MLKTAFLLLITAASIFSALSIYYEIFSENVSVQKIVLNGQVENFDETNWRALFQGEWILAIVAPWCPACRQSEKIWPALAEDLELYNVGVGKVDVTQTPELSGRFLVTALPTIYHVKDGVMRQYRGPRNVAALKDLVVQKSWQEIEPVSAWWHPKGMLMNILSQFFKFSHHLKTLNVTLQEYLGLPYWAAYIFFAVVTILLGSILGLVLVCFIDLFNWCSNDGSDKYASLPADDELADEIIADEEDEVAAELSEHDEEEDEDDDDEETSDGEKYSQHSSDEEDEDNDAAVEGSKVEELQQAEPESEPEPIKAAAVTEPTKAAEVLDMETPAPKESSENIEVRKRRVRKAD